MKNHKKERKVNKSTRWDCDVSLLRGIPNTFPSFHNWNTTNNMSSKCIDNRFNMCHTCNSWVEQSEIDNHPCWDYTNSHNIADIDMLPVGSIPNNIIESYEPFENEISPGDLKQIEKEPDIEETIIEHTHEPDIVLTPFEEDVPKYVISTEENYNCTQCDICDDNLTIVFDEELDEWIFPECIENEKKIVHAECFLYAFG